MNTKHCCYPLSDNNCQCAEQQNLDTEPSYSVSESLIPSSIKEALMLHRLVLYSLLTKDLTRNNIQGAHFVNLSDVITEWLGIPTQQVLMST